jgi:sigma-B regulation protein RsbU (phosphoserine phosphatase)
MDVCTGAVRASLYSRSCEGVAGGDVYFFSVCDTDNLTRVAIADVTGHGGAVEQLGHWMYEAVAEQMNSLEGEAVLRSLNDLACSRGIEATTTAGVVGIYPRHCGLYFANAGHPPLMVRRSGDPGWWEARLPFSRSPDNLPLGVLPDTRYDQRFLPVSRGDRMLLYTDGVIDAPNAAGDRFGVSRLAQVLNWTTTAPLSEQKTALLRALRQFVGGELNHDDVTFVLMELL